MNNVNKELPKALTIEDLKNRIGKPVFVMSTAHLKSNGWDVLTQILDESEEEESYKFLKFISGLSIRYHSVIDFRLFDTEVSEEDLQEILKEEEKSKKKTGYETVGKGEDYFFIESNMKATKEYVYRCNDGDDVGREACANHFNDETLTINLARAESLRYQLRRFAALNGGIPSVADWFNYYSWDEGSNWKHFIEYDYEEQKIHINCALTNKSFGQVYFKNKQACQKAIEIFKDELLWYFTEFQEQLY